MTSDPRLLTERNIWLATTRPSGRPHLIPIWFVWVDERFYICTGGNSVKARNLNATLQATVALEDGNRPLIAECRVELLSQAVAECGRCRVSGEIRSGVLMTTPVMTPSSR